MNSAKRISLSILTGALLLSGCAPEKLTDSQDYGKEQSNTSGVIYGTDGRLDLYQVSDDQLKRLADSTVALIENKNLILSGNSLLIKAENYGTSMRLCASEKFKEQSSGAFCSGSLVSEDTIITAGHCIQNALDCANTSFVFNYAVKNAGVLPTATTASEVYKCKSIVKQVLTSGAADFAVIKLDRKVVGHAPLAIRSQGEARVGDPLVVIGHPSGLPTKITTGGRVRSVANTDFLVASVDTYGGNSGSAVFNANTGQIEGILVRGDQDFQSQGNCFVSKVCAEDVCRGEDITRISAVRPFISNTQPPPPPPPTQSDKFSIIANLSIPDNNVAGIKSTIAVNKIPGARKVLISIDITHPYIGDLIVKVTSPSGKVAVLSSRAGGSADNIVKTIEVTSSLGSETQMGNYQISVQDLAARDVGFLNSVSIEFK